MIRADVLVVGAGLLRRHRRAPPRRGGLARARDRPAPARRRQRLGHASTRWGVRIHPYGPHLFHTDAERIVAFLSRFTGWTPVRAPRARERRRHARAGADQPHHDQPPLRPRAPDDAEVAAFLERVREQRQPERTSEDVVLNRVGRDLCDRLFRGYTRKQWGLDLADLAPLVLRRIPVRTNDDDRYFTDRHQALPSEGYARMFERMLDHPGISVALGCDFDDCRDAIAHRHLVYTGPIDRVLRPLPRPAAVPVAALRVRALRGPATASSRSARSTIRTNTRARASPSSSHFTQEAHAGTTIVREYPEAEGDPFYPIPRPENDALYQRYRELADGARRRDLRRPARAVPLLQHGPGGGRRDDGGGAGHGGAGEAAVVRRNERAVDRAPAFTSGGTDRAGRSSGSDERHIVISVFSKLKLKYAR